MKLLSIIVYILLGISLKCIAQVSLINPVEYILSPDGHHILTFESIDTTGSDDVYRPVNIRVYDTKTGSQVHSIPEQVVLIWNKYSAYWIDNDHFLYDGSKIVNIKNKIEVSRNLPQERSIIGFSSDLLETLYLEYDTVDHNRILMHRRFNPQVQDNEIARIDRYFEASDAFPPVSVVAAKKENIIYIVSYSGSKYRLIHFDFETNEAQQVAAYSADRKWDRIIFFVISDQIFVLNHSQKVLIQNERSFSINVDHIDASILYGDNILIQYDGIKIGLFNTNKHSFKSLIETNILKGKTIIQSVGDDVFIETRTGQDFHDPITFGKDYTINIDIVKLNDL